MDEIKEDIAKIYQTERGIMMIMVLNLLLAIGLMAFSIAVINPGTSVVKVGYGDIGGYRDGTWMELLAFPLLALVFGVLHSLLALRIFRKRGSSMTKFFLLTTTCLTVGAVLVLIRLLGEG